jgi:hypothetical protein
LLGGCGIADKCFDGNGVVSVLLDMGIPSNPPLRITLAADSPMALPWPTLTTAFLM